MGPSALEKVLGGPGTQHGIGAKIWHLLNGSDDSKVGQACNVPTQISLEDSYVRLDTVIEVKKELLTLAERLLDRMRVDLLEADEDHQQPADTMTDATDPTGSASLRWIAFPKTVRLTTTVLTSRKYGIATVRSLGCRGITTLPRRRGSFFDCSLLTLLRA